MSRRNAYSKIGTSWRGRTHRLHHGSERITTNAGRLSQATAVDAIYTITFPILITSATTYQCVAILGARSAAATCLITNYCLQTNTINERPNRTLFPHIGSAQQWHLRIFIIDIEHISLPYIRLPSNIPPRQNFMMRRAVHLVQRGVAQRFVSSFVR